MIPLERLDLLYMTPTW